MEFKKRDGIPTRMPNHFNGEGDAMESDDSLTNFASSDEEKPGSPAPTVQPSETIIEVTASFDGTFSTEQDLRVRGKVSGEVSCKGRFIVERDAVANARIEARDAEIHGEVTGDLVCSGRLQLSRSAVVRGTIRAGALVVEEGASVSGSVETVSAAQEDGIVTRTHRTSQGPAPESEPAPTKPRREVPSFALVQSDDAVPVTHR